MNITDITPIIDAFIKLVCAFILVVIIPWLNKARQNENMTAILKIADEVARVAKIVVSAANELEITGELRQTGLTKAEYALAQAKKELNSRGIVVDDEQIINQIKAAVTELRVKITNTSAEKK